MVRRCFPVAKIAGSSPVWVVFFFFKYFLNIFFLTFFLTPLLDERLVAIVRQGVPKVLLRLHRLRDKTSARLPHPRGDHNSCLSDMKPIIVPVMVISPPL
jgi:hypothetical protein